jgi:hypothetical protein
MRREDRPATGDATSWNPGEADGGHAKAASRTGGERTPVREPKPAGANAGGIVRCKPEGV